MLIREANEADLDVVTELRLRFIVEHRGDEGPLPASFRSATRDFIRRRLDDGTIRSWLAEQDGVVVGLVTMVLLDLPPRPQDVSGREGYIVNMYVAPEHRRRGVGRELMEALMRRARELRLRRLALYATDAGRPLYESVGFVPNPTWMELAL